jgi:hypothetical protein
MLHLAIMDALIERVVSAAQWDADPELLAVHVDGLEVTLTRMPVPPSVWDGPGGPGAGLEMFAEAIPPVRPGLPPGVTGELHALAFVHEGWTVENVDLTDHHAWRRVQKMAGEGRLRFHPDAREIRAVAAVDVAGNVYHVKLVRGSGETETRIAVPGDDYEPSGIIVDALDELVEKMTGAPRQKRPDGSVQVSGEMN